MLCASTVWLMTIVLYSVPRQPFVVLIGGSYTFSEDAHAATLFVLLQPRLEEGNPENKRPRWHLVEQTSPPHRLPTRMLIPPGWLQTPTPIFKPDTRNCSSSELLILKRLSIRCPRQRTRPQTRRLKARRTPRHRRR